ncbi:MAG: hypothetical protein ACYTG0_29880 [Planctomycetota bacterium]
MSTTAPETVDPFDDPFGDGEAMPSPSNLTLQGDLSEPAQLEPTPRGDLSKPKKPMPKAKGAPPRLEIEDVTEETVPLGRAEAIPDLPPDWLAVAEQEGEDPCAALEFKPIDQITHDISVKKKTLPQECPLAQSGLPDRQTTGWAPVTFTWKASALCHKPVYFEDVHLERYGHSSGPYLQPLISGAHFFLTVPVLPYKMGLYPPNECMYTLGYYRPGSCAPYMLDPLPLSVRAGLAQAAAWTGLIYAIP